MHSAYILSILRFHSAVQRANGRTFPADIHATSVSKWLFPTSSVQSAGFVRIAVRARDVGV